uniref:Peptidase A1 domain-containing protein n=1 Tax=Brassica oleracea var. oleracea TaxID=109376 RepID=A0A0D3EE56_BRAOL
MHGLKRLIIFISMFAAISEAQYLLPITKNETTKQYYTTINIGSAANSPVNLLLDIGTDLSWLNCRKIKSLSSLHLVPCQSPTCKSIPSNACDGKHCLYLQQSPFVKNHTVSTVDRVVQDKATISTKVSFRPFTFSCVAQTHIQGLSPPIAGVLGLSPGEFPFWRQVTRAFNIIPRFAICLPSSGNGNFFIGGGGFGVSMTLTPLKIVGSDYLISPTSIYVDGIPLSLNPSLLESGAKLSTVVPYTVLQTDIYNALASAFTRKAIVN